MKKRKILYISGSRADYGLMKEALFTLSKNLKLQLEIMACGMHLMPEFGNTVNEIKKDGFKIHRAWVIYKNDQQSSMVDFLGEAVLEFNKQIKKIKPDIILLLGDRAEMLAGAICGAYLAIPVAHISGGDKSSTVDDVVRNAITKLANLHFPSTKKSAQRIAAMGEQTHRIHVVGAAGLDQVTQTTLLDKKEIAKKYALDLGKPLIIVIQHPVTAEVVEAKKQMEQTLEAVKELGLQAIVIYPNADAGGRAIIKAIEAYQGYPYIKIHKNIPRADYLSLLRLAGALVGNSSSGIVESPIFHLPVVNIGTRQKGRERANNVIDVDYKKEEIKKAIEKALYNNNFKKKLKNIKNPYGNGGVGQKISKILSTIIIDEKLLQK